MTPESIGPRDASPVPHLATLADVDILSELDRRPRRAPDYEREHRAFARLTEEMAEHPREMLQKLVEIAVDLCGADTAGISLLDGAVFRWEAVAGVFAGARNGTMPRNLSPCGICIDRDATQLMHLPDRCFPALLAEPRFVEALLIPFHDHGTAIGTVWIVSHTTEKTFDREDERVVSALSHFASVAWQLWKASEALADSNRRKDDFLATLSHELRNPLAVITTATALLRPRTSEDALATRAIDAIARQSQHVSRLVEDLLDIARIANGKLRLNRRPIDLRTVVSETVEMRRLQLERRRHVLTVELGQEPLMVNGDPVRLAQIVSNLVDNAAKYTPDEGHISVAVTSEDGHAVLAVKDSGVGVAAEHVQSIFEPFAQLSESRAAFGGGLGLGLALVRSVAELHGGGVQLVSRGAGQGSCFTVRLPVWSGAPAPESAGVERPSFSQNGERTTAASDHQPAA